VIARLFWSLFPPTVGEIFRRRSDPAQRAWKCTTVDGAYARLETDDGQWRRVWRPWFVLPGTEWMPD
jgi:hypothetical protein